MSFKPLPSTNLKDDPNQSLWLDCSKLFGRYRKSSRVIHPSWLRVSQRESVTKNKPTSYPDDPIVLTLATRVYAPAEIEQGLKCLESLYNYKDIREKIEQKKQNLAHLDVHYWRLLRKLNDEKLVPPRYIPISTEEWKIISHDSSITRHVAQVRYPEIKNILFSCGITCDDVVQIILDYVIELPDDKRIPIGATLWFTRGNGRKYSSRRFALTIQDVIYSSLDTVFQVYEFDRTTGDLTRIREFPFECINETIKCQIHNDQFAIKVYNDNVWKCCKPLECTEDDLTFFCQRTQVSTPWNCVVSCPEGSHVYYDW